MIALFDIVLQQSLKALSDNFDMLVDSLVKRGICAKVVRHLF
jgi:hypothetical protein